MLVVGGTSFIGRHFLERRAAAGLATMATCRDVSAAPVIGGVSWVTSDLTTDDAERDWPMHCDAVVALSQSREWRQFPAGAADVFAVNVHGAFRIAEYARRSGARQLVYASSGSIYGATPAPLIEQAAIDLGAARHFYVSSKLAAEALLSGYRGSLNIKVLRLFIPYGRFQDDGMLLPQIVRKVTNDEAVVLDRDGGLLINPVAVDDVCETIERSQQLDESVTFNVGGPDALRLREIAETIGRVVDRAPRFEHRDAAAALIVGPTDAMQRTLGWSPTTSLEEGLRRWLVRR